MVGGGLPTKHKLYELAVCGGGRGMAGRVPVCTREYFNKESK